VRSHVAPNGFEGYFAVAPIEMTQLLIEAFGLEVVSAPRAPVVLIEADGAPRLLGSGGKSTDGLLEILGLEPGSEPNDGRRF
jgi:hypothetical protein